MLFVAQGRFKSREWSMTTLPTTTRADALNLSTDLAQAGTVFNDATRLLDGGLWSKPADSNNQAAYEGMYTTDIHAVLADVNAMLAAPDTVTVNGNPYTPTQADLTALTKIHDQLQSLLTEAPLSVGSSRAAATAQQDLHTTQTAILNEINGDTGLASALAANPYPASTGADGVGFEALPVGSDDAAARAAATAPGATLAQIGNVFNAATDLAVGGLNRTNLPQFDADMKAVASGLGNLINDPAALSALETAAGETGAAAALTTIHLQTLLNQTNLQIDTFDKEYATNHNVAARATNDNLLDMIDIVQGDPALNVAAGGNGNPGTVGGFAEMPAYLSGTIQHFQDNQAQTNFWSQFLSESNVIANQLNNVAMGNDASPADLRSLVTEIQNYEKFGQTFDSSQGGIFGARFDNELRNGTLQADSTAAVTALRAILNGDTGTALAADQAQVQAAGMGFAANAMDVSGNNTPVGGGSYVGTATTVAGATSPAGLAQGTIPVTGAANGATGLAQSGGFADAGGRHDTHGFGQIGLMLHHG
jgi:trimeric autotransporter adhesin